MNFNGFIQILIAIIKSMQTNVKSLIQLVFIIKIIKLIQSVCLTQQTDFSTNYVTNGNFSVPNLNGGYRVTTSQIYGWKGNKIEQGSGNLYNSNWPPGTQAIELDVDVNEMYNQTLILPKSKFFFKISYAARIGKPLNSSGIRIWWNNKVIRDLQASVDYLIHTESYILEAQQGENLLVLQGRGISDAQGISCTNIVFHKIESFNRVEVNGTCICQTGYFDDLANWKCQPCESMDPLCLQCDYFAVNGTDGTSFHTFVCSQCQPGYYSNGGPCVPCEYATAGCINCTMNGECFACNATEQYFQNPLFNYTQNITNSNFCQLCSLQGCILCTSLTHCSACDLNNSYYFQNSSIPLCSYCDSTLNLFINFTTEQCQPCSLIGCQKCLNITHCGKCAPSLYYLDNSTYLCEPCQVEGCFQCKTSTQCKICDQSKHYSLNKLHQCDYCLSCSCFIAPSTVNKAVPPLYYSQSECHDYKTIQRLGNFIAVTSYIIMVFSLISIKIVGIELFGVLQLAFFNLADNEFVNLYLSPFQSWKYFNGYNVDLPQHNTFESTTIPQRIKAISYGSSFISNMNIMLLVLVIQFILSLILVFISRYILILSKISKFLIKQVFITLFLFNSLNIAFSFTLHFKYASTHYTQNYVLSSIAAVVAFAFYFIILFALEYSDPEEFGEYKNKFKRDPLNYRYMTISILYRMCLGVYMAASNEQILGTLLILTFAFSYFLYNLVNLPFIDAYQNYRANLCHLTQIIILLVTNYYRSMKNHQEIEVKSRRYGPAQMQIVMVALTVIVSAVALTYQIYITIKRRLRFKKLDVGYNLGLVTQPQDISHVQIHTTVESMQNVIVKNTKKSIDDY